MTTNIRLATSVVAILVTTFVRVEAQPGAPKRDPDRLGGWAITASGKMVTHGHNKKAPWLEDAIKTVPTYYPMSERSMHHQGSGMFHISINPQTGLVIRVTVNKSTGFSALDDAVKTTFRQWRWRPGTWKEIEFPVTFNLTRTSPAGTKVGSVPVSRS